MYKTKAWKTFLILKILKIPHKSAVKQTIYKVIEVQGVREVSL